MHSYPRRASLQGLESIIFKLMSFGATPEQWAEWLNALLEHTAARGNLDLVAKLLQDGADGSARWRGCRGRTLPDAAAVGGNADVVSSLLGKGDQSDVNIVSVSSGQSALYTATVLGHEAAARRLIFAGADVNFWDPVDMCDVLHMAVRGGHEQLVNDLLLRVCLTDCWDKNGATLLHHAALQGYEGITRALLQRGAYKDLENFDGASPLFLAVKEGRLGTAEILLAAGADVSIRLYDSDCSALDVAARDGNVDMLEAFVRHGWDLDARDGCGYSPLHWAAISGRVGAIGVLIDQGINVDVVCDDGNTPLHFASCHWELEAMLALLQRGAQVNQRSSHSSETPLQSVCLWMSIGAEAATDLLLRWGADETVLDTHGRTLADLIDQNYILGPYAFLPCETRLCSHFFFSWSETATGGHLLTTC